MKRAVIVGSVFLLLFGVVVLVKQMKSTASDSRDAAIASEIRVQLAVWFEEKREYPNSLVQVWSEGAMRDYRAKYGIPDELREKFNYSGHSSWYELSFTNFGAIQSQIGSNGVIIR